MVESSCPSDLLAQVPSRATAADVEISPDHLHQCSVCNLWHANHGCLGGRMHGAVVTADDDPGDYDPRVLGPTPNGYQYGYCINCKAAFRWSADEQQWVPWTDEERHMARIETAVSHTARQREIEELLT